MTHPLRYNSTAMKAEMYVWTTCPFCVRAKALLLERGVELEEHVMDARNAELDEVKDRYRHFTVPIILLDGEFIGGYDELTQLDRSGHLSPKD